MNKLILLIGFVVSQSAASPISYKAVIGMFSGDKYQGDIKLNKAQETILLENKSQSLSMKTGWTWEGFRWPNDTNGHVIVPYIISYSDGFCMKF